MRGAGREFADQPAHAVAAIGQHRDRLSHRQILSAQNLAEPPPGLLILAPDQAEVTVIATCGHGFADDDLEVVLFVVPVPDVAAVDADDDCRLRERLAIGGTALDGTRLLAAEVGFVAGGNLVQVTADGRRVNSAIDRQDVLQQAGGHAVGNQRGPARLEIEQLRGGMLGEEPGQRAEALGNTGLAEAAMKTWADQRDGAESSAELDPAPPLTQQPAAAEITAPMPVQKARRLS